MARNIQGMTVRDHYHADDIIRAVEALTRNWVMVGVPDTTTNRTPQPGHAAGPITNASIAYVQNFGSPRLNIPSREFMYSGLAPVREQVIRSLKRAADYAIMGDRALTIATLHALGLIAQNAIRRKITQGPFAPLSPYTILNRRRPGDITNLHQLGPLETSARHAQITGIRPLIDTGQLRRSITYVLRGAWF